MKQVYFFIKLIMIMKSFQCDYDSSIQASGEGTATGIPDIATLFVLVSNYSTSANQTTKNIRDTLNQVLRIVDWNGIPITSIETINMNLAPKYNNQQILGYEANQTIVIKNMKIIAPGASQVGTIYEQLVRLPGVTLSGLKFQYSDQQALIQQARRNSYNTMNYQIQVYVTLAGFSSRTTSSIRQIKSVLSYPNQYNLTDLISFKQAVPGVFTVKIKSFVLAKYSGY